MISTFRIAASHSVCSDFTSTCLVSGCLLWRCLFSSKSTGLRHDSLSVLLHQPSSCQLYSRQSADDCDNKRADNSIGDEHNDVRNFFSRDNLDDKCSDHDRNNSDHNDVDVRNCDCFSNCSDHDSYDIDVRNCYQCGNCDHNCDVDQHYKCICRQLNLNCFPLDHRHAIFKRCT